MRKMKIMKFRGDYVICFLYRMKFRGDYSFTIPKPTLPFLKLNKVIFVNIHKLRVKIVIK